MQKLINPHDRFFKEVFSNKQTAVDFLTGALPPKVLEILDLSGMEIRKDSFIDEELRESFSDLLYEVRLAGAIGYIYVLFEHKSFPDRFTVSDSKIHDQDLGASFKAIDKAGSAGRFTSCSLPGSRRVEGRESFQGSFGQGA